MGVSAQPLNIPTGANGEDSSSAAPPHEDCRTGVHNESAPVGTSSVGRGEANFDAAKPPGKIQNSGNLCMVSVVKVSFEYPKAPLTCRDMLTKRELLQIRLMQCVVSKDGLTLYLNYREYSDFANVQAC
jgi:hypothetical protein